MNVLVLTNTNSPVNGWGTVCSGIVNEFERVNEVEVDVLTSNNGNWKSIKSLKSEFFSKFSFISTIYDCLFILLYMLRSKKKYDVILCVVEHYSLPAKILSYLLNVKVVVICHGTFSVLLPHNSRAYKWAFQSSDMLICVSEYTKKRMIEDGIIGKYRVIKNGVDLNKFKILESNIERKDILFVGNLKERKGFDFLLNAVISYQKKYNDKIIINFAGKVNENSSDYFKVHEKAKNNNVQVNFLGMVSELELINLYQTALLNVLPSKSEPYFFEGFGLIHLEANSCGCLTVGTLNSGNECAINVVNGFLVDYADVDQLTEIIGKVSCMDNYPKIDLSCIDDWSVVSNKYISIMKELLR